MIVEIAIGDAYGAGFEYVDRRITDQHNNLSGNIRYWKWIRDFRTHRVAASLFCFL